MRLIKFRIYNPIEERMIDSGATPMMLHSFFQATAPFDTRDGMEYQQFTGLLDKAGKEIYEGDIAQHFGQRKAAFIHEVEHHYGAFGYWCDKGKEWQEFISYHGNKNFHKPIMVEVEIIGNIYENLELLEVTDE